MSDARNPYAPPVAPVADPVEPIPDSADELIPNGRFVSPGHGASWIGLAWRMFWARPGKWLVLLLLLIVLYVAVLLVPFVNILFSLAWPFIAGGIVIAADLQRRTGTFSIESCFGGFRRPAPLLVVGSLFLLAIAATYASYAIVFGAGVANQFVLHLGPTVDPRLLTVGGLGRVLVINMLLVLPITAATVFAPPLIILHGLSAGTAIRMSLLGAVKNILAGIVFWICVILFFLVSMLPLGLGLFISIPVMMITTYTVYRDIFVR